MTHLLPPCGATFWHSSSTCTKPTTSYEAEEDEVGFSQSSWCQWRPRLSACLSLQMPEELGASFRLPEVPCFPAMLHSSAAILQLQEECRDFFFFFFGLYAPAKQVCVHVCVVLLRCKCTVSTMAHPLYYHETTNLQFLIRRLFSGSFLPVKTDVNVFTKRMKTRRWHEEDGAHGKSRNPTFLWGVSSFLSLVHHIIQNSPKSTISPIISMVHLEDLFCLL